MACHRTPSPSPSASPDAGSSPLSRLQPRSTSGPRHACPLEIVPGIRFGPVALGETLDDLRRGGLLPGDVSATHAEIASTGLQVSLCEGKIIDVWLDDLRVGPDCVRYEGAPIGRSIRREALEQRFGDWTAMPPGIGAAYERCAGGGLYIGHGLDDSLQLRVAPRGFAFDDTCAIATDDGTSVELSPSARSSLLRQTLNLSELSKYWHVDRPGRDPLRIVRTPFFPEEPLKMFGSPVCVGRCARREAGHGVPDNHEGGATRTKTTVAFAYPVEGIAGSAVFAHRSGPDEWRLET